MNRTLAVVVTYNRLNMLKKCIDCILSQDAACDLLIVDNASSDGSGDYCLDLISKRSDQGRPLSGRKIIYENTKANLGGAGGFNHGLRRAYELGYEYAWIMDDDALAEKNCLSELLKYTDREFGFLCSAVLWTDGSVCRMNWQRKFYLPKKRCEHHINDSDIESPEAIRVQSATFVSLLIPTNVIKTAGLPIKEFFIWCDDIEYTRRIALKYALPCYFIPTSRIIHHIANNTGTDLASDSAERIDRYNYAFRNENFMYRQYGIKGFIYYIVVCIYNSFKVITKARSHKGRRLKVIFKNFFSGLFFNPPVERL